MHRAASGAAWPASESRRRAKRSMIQPVNKGPPPSAKTFKQMYSRAVAVARCRWPTTFCTTPKVGPSEAYWKKPAQSPAGGRHRQSGCSTAQQIEWRGDEAAERRNQRIPSHVPRGQSIGDESAGNDSDADRNSPRETGENADGRVVEVEGAAEVRRQEGVKSVRRKRADVHSENHVQNGPVGQQRLGHRTQLAQFGFQGERRQGRPVRIAGLRIVGLGMAARRLSNEDFDQHGDHQSRQSHHGAGGAPSPVLRHVAAAHRGQQIPERNSAGINRQARNCAATARNSPKSASARAASSRPPPLPRPL